MIFMIIKIININQLILVEPIESCNKNIKTCYDGFDYVLENKVINYIEDNYETIEKDMNTRNSTSKRKELSIDNNSSNNNTKTRKKREELSISATKSIKKEKVEIVVNFS